MVRRAIQKVFALDLEEKILNGASLVALVCVFFPWFGGERVGLESVSHSGLGFYTSFLGLTVLALHTYILLITLIPLTGGPTLVRRKNRDVVRLHAASLATILTLGIWSVLTKFTFEFSYLEIHFGLYGTLIGSLTTTLYAFLQYQEERRSEVRKLFYPDEQNLEMEQEDLQPREEEQLFAEEKPVQPRRRMTPPPASKEPEEHHMRIGS